MPRLINQTEYENRLFFIVSRICFLSMRLHQQSDFALLGRVESMNLGFKSKLMRSLFARIRYAVESYVDSYVESSVEPKCKRRFEYVKVVPLSRCSTVLRALFRDDQVVMQPTMITLPSSPAFSSSSPSSSSSSSSSLFGLKRPFQNISFLSQVILTGTSVPPLHFFA